MKKLVDWITNHQVVAFFILAFAITWGLGFSYGALLQRSNYLLAPLVFVATCGPALAGIIISALTNIQPVKPPRKAFWLAFSLVWILSANDELCFHRLVLQPQQGEYPGRRCGSCLGKHLLFLFPEPGPNGFVHHNGGGGTRDDPC